MVQSNLFSRAGPHWRRLIVSLWSPDRLDVVFGPERIVFRHQNRRDHRSWVCHAAPGTPMETPWQSTMRAFERELPMISLRKGTRLSFFLNSQYIRYRIVPWRTQFIAPVAHAAFVEHCFVDAFGEVARQWTFRASRSQYGKASLAAALDSELLESLDR